jgi:16S rRNA (adenine1518-N6/adenine1519-N6)-dimethyltransferase
MYTKPKKSLGQNFLVDKNIQRKIISGCELKLSDNILEIGPGNGELTKLIASRVNKIVAVEIDGNLFQELKNIFKNCKNIKIVNRDILSFNPNRYFRNSSNKDRFLIKVIGNIPYYISTPIIEHLFNFKKNIKTIFITVQKEFAKRVTASPGSKDYGSLSCFVQYNTDPKILFTIKRGSFFPVPKIDSCLLRLNIRHEKITVKDERLFFKIVRGAFNKRRKTLRNSLNDILSQKKLKTFFEKFSKDPNIRPEDLTLQDFANLANL